MNNYNEIKYKNKNHYWKWWKKHKSSLKKNHKKSRFWPRKATLWTHSVGSSWYRERIQMRPICSRCMQTWLCCPHKGSLCIHLFHIYICACSGAAMWSVSLARLGQPMCLAAGEPSDPGRVTVLARANERMQGGWGGGGGMQWEGGGRGKGGADGVTECLGTCHSVSALASTSGLRSLSPQAKQA